MGYDFFKQKFVAADSAWQRSKKKERAENFTKEKNGQRRASDMNIQQTEQHDIGMFILSCPSVNRV